MKAWVSVLAIALCVVSSNPARALGLRECAVFATCALLAGCVQPQTPTSIAPKEPLVSASPPAPPVGRSFWEMDHAAFYADGIPFCQQGRVFLTLTYQFDQLFVFSECQTGLGGGSYQSTWSGDGDTVTYASGSFLGYKPKGAMLRASDGSSILLRLADGGLYLFQKRRYGW